MVGLRFVHFKVPTVKGVVLSFHKHVRKVFYDDGIHYIDESYYSCHCDDGITRQFPLYAIKQDKQ
jgi:hypothetical protein